MGYRQILVKRGARPTLHAMIRPQRLFAIRQGDRLERPLARMRGGEGDVAGGVPILGQHDMGEALAEAVDERHDRIAVADRQRAAGHEIILHVDDEKDVPFVNRNPNGHGVTPWRG